MPERFHYPLPEVFFLPSAVASVHRQTRPELLFGQIPPLRSCDQNPHDPGEYLTTIASGPSRGRLLRGHKRRLSRVSRPLFTRVPRRRILRSSPLGGSRKAVCRGFKEGRA